MRDGSCHMGNVTYAASYDRDWACSALDVLAFAEDPGPGSGNAILAVAQVSNADRPHERCCEDDRGFAFAEAEHELLAAIASDPTVWAASNGDNFHPTQQLIAGATGDDANGVAFIHKNTQPLSLGGIGLSYHYSITDTLRQYL